MFVGRKSCFNIEKARHQSTVFLSTIFITSVCFYNVGLNFAKTQTSIDPNFCSKSCWHELILYLWPTQRACKNTGQERYSVGTIWYLRNWNPGYFCHQKFVFLFQNFIKLKMHIRAPWRLLSPFLSLRIFDVC